MAFMLPVMRNNFDIYKDNRSRKISECSNVNATINSALSNNNNNNNNNTSSGRRRKVSESKSENFTTLNRQQSPNHSVGVPTSASYAASTRMQRCPSTSARGFSRTASRGSHNSLMSPTRSFNNYQPTAAMSSLSNSPPKATRNAVSQSSKSSCGINSGGGDAAQQQQQQNDFSKFHMRLVDKLRRSFRKDNAKRS